MNNIRPRKVIFFLGGGAHTLPTYRAQLEILAKDYEITLFSEFYIRRQNYSDYYTIKSVPSWKVPRRTQVLCFGLMVFIELLFKRVHIIHTHSTYPSGLTGIILGKLFKRPVILSLDAAEGIGISSIGFGDMLHKNRTKVNRYVVDNASVITALTNFHRDSIKLNLKTEKEIRLIPRGVDCSRFQFSMSFSKSVIQFLNVGYINPVKDQQTLLRSFAILCKAIPCHLTLIGRDYTGGAMNKLCEELDISEHVSFKGHISYHEIHKYYEMADVLVHTSVYESQALAVSEALASGVLVCGTKVGIMADLDKSCCVTVAPGDYSSLASKILDAIKDRSRMNELTSNGRKWAKEHDLQWTVDRYKELYESISK